MSPDLYRLLVTERGWPPGRYQQWLAAALTGQLLPQAAREDASHADGHEPG